MSKVIRAMPFVWLRCDDPPGPRSVRGFVERNAIALLSNARAPLDRPTEHWLGWRCSRERVTRSGLWNNNHVDDDYDPAFLDLLDELA